MERCPICGGSFRDKEWICSACGYDASADWMRYPTFVYLKTIENVSLKKKTESTMSAQEVQQRVRERIREIQTKKNETREQVFSTKMDLKKRDTLQSQMHCSSEEKELVQSGECGDMGENVKWSFFDDGLLQIEGIGAMRDYVEFMEWGTPWKKFRNQITQVEVKLGVTEVGECAFCNCKNLWKVQLADSVQKIHGWAFEGCEQLTSLRLPTSMQEIGKYAFGYCKNLTEIKLPEGLEKLDECVFVNCIHLQSVILPDGLKVIARLAFGKCTALKSVCVPRSVIDIHPLAFEGCQAKSIQSNETKIEVVNKTEDKQETSMKEETSYYDELLAILNKRR